jgi:hypothetical protein
LKREVETKEPKIVNLQSGYSLMIFSIAGVVITASPNQVGISINMFNSYRPI